MLTDARLPFIDTTDQLLFVFYILARVAGFFAISPLFSNRNIVPAIRTGLIVFTTALIAMVIYPDYYGENARFTLPYLPEDKGFSLILNVPIHFPES